MASRADAAVSMAPDGSACPDDRRFDPVQSILPTGPAVGPNVLALNRVHTTRGPVRRRASLIVVITKISPCEAASGRSLVN